MRWQPPRFSHRGDDVLDQTLTYLSPAPQLFAKFIPLLFSKTMLFADVRMKTECHQAGVDPHQKAYFYCRWAARKAAFNSHRNLLPDQIIGATFQTLRNSRERAYLGFSSRARIS
jgi:hypothetical protein